jgi:hypothetical protein
MNNLLTLGVFCENKLIPIKFLYDSCEISAFECLLCTIFLRGCADARHEEGKAVVAPGAYIRLLIE